MKDNDAPPGSKPARTRWRWLLVLVLMAVLVALARVWYLRRTAPGRHFRAALEAFERGDLDAVQTAAEALEGLPGYEPHLHLLEGMVLVRSGRLLEAIAEFGHARDHPQTRAMAYALSGEALYKAGILRDAPRILSTAVELDPSYTDARRWLAAAYFDLGAMNHAIGHLEVVAEQAPGDPRPHRLLGVIYRDFEEYRKAILACRESLRRDPEQPDKEDLLIQLAECLVKQRSHAEALETLGQCPRSAQTLTLQAECHNAQGDQTAARKLVGEALQLAHDHLDAMQLRAIMDLESNDAPSAVRILRQAVASHPKQWRVRYQLARAYRQAGQQELAQEQIEIMQELRRLRDRFTKLHDHAMADPADVETRYQLGLVARQLDLPILARDWLMVALAMDPEHAGAREALEAMMRGAPSPQEGAASRP